MRTEDIPDHKLTDDPFNLENLDMHDVTHAELNRDSSEMRKSISHPPPDSLPVLNEVSIKEEPNLDDADYDLAGDKTAGKGTYFKPDVLPDENPTVGYIRCRVCQSFFLDDNDKRNQHLRQHQERVFIVNLPTEMTYFDMEEVIEHCAKRLSIPNGDIAEKMFKCKLVNYPTSLAAFSCGAWPEGRRFLDTSSEKEFNRHVKEMCGVRSKEERNRYKISWCGGCHTRFDTLDELNQHLEYNKVSKTFCFPNKCRDCGSKSDDETNSPAAKRAKTTGFKMKEELLKMMKKDGKNAKLWEQVEERQVANKKGFSHNT